MWRHSLLASYPGFLTTAFVTCTCSTNVGEDLLKLVMYMDIGWACGGAAHSGK